MDRQVLQVEVCVGVLIQGDLVPFVERGLSMFLVKQIIPAFVIDFEIRNIDVEVDGPVSNLSPLPYLIE